MMANAGFEREIDGDSRGGPRRRRGDRGGQRQDDRLDAAGRIGGARSRAARGAGAPGIGTADCIRQSGE